MINDISISIITLTKNDHLKFAKTLNSIKSQKRTFNIEWVIVDGSNKKTNQKNKEFVEIKFNKDKKIFINHTNSKDKNIKGIYECMNYGKNISKGDFIIFLNSGDIFFNRNASEIYFKQSLNIDIKNSLIFGQANIIANNNINWFFPGNNLKNINHWLRFFEPNHQTMLVSNNLARRFDFPTKYNILGDGYWKRQILNEAKNIFFIKKPLIKFFLDGVSSTKPSRKVFKGVIMNKNISLFRKTIFIIKYFFPIKIYSFYYLFQKFKSNLVDFLL